MIDRLRSYAGKATKLWFNWASFKLGMFVGAIAGMLYMAFLLTTTGTAQSIIEAVR